MITHPYREPGEPTKPTAAIRKRRSWLWRLWTGDDGHLWAVVAEPSPFRRAESQLLGPYTKRLARTMAQSFVNAHPYGQAIVYQLPLDQVWPPKTTFDRLRASREG